MVGKRKQTLIVLALSFVLFSTLIVSARADFATSPTLDLTTSSQTAGANAVYSFHVQNNDSSMSAKAFNVTIPAGCLITFPLIANMTLAGLVGDAGQIGFSPIVSFHANTTSTPGKFRIYGNLIGSTAVFFMGNVSVKSPTLTLAGYVSGSLNPGYYLPNKWYVDLLINVMNPSNPGTYVFGPNTVTPATGNVTSMNPRSGYTNSITILGNAVGGDVLPANALAVPPSNTALIATAGLFVLVAAAVACILMARSKARKSD